jgi:hypothetical protein
MTDCRKKYIGQNLPKMTLIKKKKQYGEGGPNFFLQNSKMQKKTKNNLFCVKNNGKFLP